MLQGGKSIPFCHFSKAEERRAIGGEHHWIIQGHSDDAHTLQGCLWHIPDPLPRHIRHTSGDLSGVRDAILGRNVASELPIELIVQLHFAIGGFDPLTVSLHVSPAAKHEDNPFMIGILLKAVLAQPLQLSWWHGNFERSIAPF